VFVAQHHDLFALTVVEDFDQILNAVFASELLLACPVFIRAELADAVETLFLEFETDVGQGDELHELLDESEVLYLLVQVLVLADGGYHADDEGLPFDVVNRVLQEFARHLPYLALSEGIGHIVDEVDQQVDDEQLHVLQVLVGVLLDQPCVVFDV